MKRLFFIIIVFNALAGNAQPNAATGGIFVDPVTIDFNLNNGQTGSAKVIISNHFKVKIPMRLYLNDWFRDTIGDHVYLAPNTTSRSCSNWITLDKSFVEIGPGQRAEINVKMHIPDSLSAVKEMKWSMLFIEIAHEQVAPSTKGLSTNVSTTSRYGVHLYQTPPTLTTKDLKMLSFGALPNTKNKYRIVCVNSGETQLLNCKSYLELSNIADNKKFRIEVKPFPLFPGQKRYINFTIPVSVPAGKYTVVAVVDAGSDVPLEVSETTIEISQ